MMLRFLLSGIFLLSSAQCFAIDKSRLLDKVLAESDAPPLSLEQKWSGDLPGMVERRQIRVLVVYNKLMYFLDGGVQRGVTYEGFTEFERFLNNKLEKKTLKVRVLFVPVSRAQLLPALLEGRGDIAAANLTVIPERLQQVDFSKPIFEGVREILVSAASEAEITSLEELAGEEIWVRKSSSYFHSLRQINAQWVEAGREPIRIRLADENLEDGDLLEMLNASLIGRTVVDQHKADLWQTVFKSIRVNRALSFREKGEIALAIRKNSPELIKILNEFVDKHKKGTLLGNILFKRYLVKNKWVRNALTKQELKKFYALVEFFQKYAERYEFDWLMLAALAYQESGLDQSKRSAAGAVGVMQVLPTTAADPKVDIDNIVTSTENNIHAGTKYLDVLRTHYLNQASLDPLNRTLLTFASYNAGPSKIRRLREEAANAGLDPDKWFDNVEIVVARKIGRETVQYVSNIYKYYLAYQRIAEQIRLKEEAKVIHR